MIEKYYQGAVSSDVVKDTTLLKAFISNLEVNVKPRLIKFADDNTWQDDKQ